MAPRRMPKVTSRSSSSSASAPASSSRGRNANPFGPVDPSSYDDYDEAMQDGVELEEKGERFQFGPKAQRFYVQAGTLYARAVSLAGRNVERKADALYNASRIHFLLATQFALPPDNLQSLVEAVTAAQEAARLAPSLWSTESMEGALPNPFTLDTMSQLATSIQTLAELTAELGWPQEVVPPSTIQGQQEPPSSKAFWQQAIEIFQQVADGQNVILQDQKATETAVEEPIGSSSELSTEKEAGEGEEQSHDGDVYGYTSSLVTPASLMETLLSLLSCLTSLVENATTLEEIMAHNSAIERIVARAQALVFDASSATSLSAMSSNAVHSTSETAARWEEAERSAFTARVAFLSKAVELGAEIGQIGGELESAMQHASEWSARLLASPAANKPVTDRKGADVATLCDVSEACQNLCRVSLRLSPAEAGVAAIWTLATSSTKLFSQALAALDTASGGSAAVLGQANTSTPVSRARCRILLALSSLSVFRSHPGFEAAGIAGAKGTQVKLVDNARLYARKAVTEIGLASVLRPLPANVPRTTALPPPGGWESQSLEAEAILHLLRALLVRANTSATLADAKAKAEMQDELFQLSQHIRQLRQRPIQIGATPASASTELAAWLYSQGAKTFVDGVVDDNGRKVIREEISWWEKLFAEQLG